jgi:2'-5' RNA ligase
MPYAVTLRLDEAAAAHLCRLQAALAADDLIDYAPHLTLAVYPDDSSIDDEPRAVERLVARWPPVAVEFAALGLFPGASVLWVAPVVTAELLRRHAELLAALPTTHPLYRPGAWVPHVTLAQDLIDPAAAIAALVPVWQPFSGRLDRVEIVRFTPVEVLASWTLHL